MCLLEKYSRRVGNYKILCELWSEQFIKKLCFLQSFRGGKCKGKSNCALLSVVEPVRVRKRGKGKDCLWNLRDGQSASLLFWERRTFFGEKGKFTGAGNNGRCCTLCTHSRMKGSHSGFFLRNRQLGKRKREVRRIMMMSRKYLFISFDDALPGPEKICKLFVPVVFSIMHALLTMIAVQYKLQNRRETAS